MCSTRPDQAGVQLQTPVRLQRRAVIPSALGTRPRRPPPRLGRTWLDPVSAATAATAKFAAARAVLDTGRRLIWTDDDAIPESGPLRDQLTATGRALLIAPVPSRGLQPRDFDAIDAFLAADDWDEPTSTTPEKKLRIASRLLGEAHHREASSPHLTLLWMLTDAPRLDVAIHREIMDGLVLVFDERVA